MTSTPPASPPRIAGYDFAAPTEGDVIAALARVFGEPRGAELWARACRGAGLRGSASSPAQLALAVERLAVEGGAAATVARSVTIRLRTFERLAARVAASRGVTA